MRNKLGISFSLNGLACSVFLAVFVLQGGLFAQGSCTDAAEIGDETVNGSTQDAPRSGDSDCGRSGNSPSNWYKFTAKANGSVTVRTCGSDYDTVLSVYSGCPGEEGNELSCNDDTCGLQSEVEFNATDGGEYLVRVAGYRGATGNYTLEVSSGGGGPGPGDISGKRWFRTGPYRRAWRWISSRLPELDTAAERGACCAASQGPGFSGLDLDRYLNSVAAIFGTA